MKKIPLTQGQVALVDDDDYKQLNKHKWYAHWDPHTHSFYAKRCSKRRTISMAREIVHARSGQQVDHINHDTLDNRKANLRLCACNENHQNRRKHRNCTSRYKGVCYDKRRHKWCAKVFYKGHNHHLGYFVDEAEAALAYDGAAKKHFGRFACLNFPGPNERSALQ